MFRARKRGLKGNRKLMEGNDINWVFYSIKVEVGLGNVVVVRVVLGKGRRIGYEIIRILRLCVMEGGN